MKFEERVAIINREFNYDIDPRGNLDSYWKITKFLRLDEHKIHDMSEQSLINCINYYKLNQERKQYEERKRQLLNRINYVDKQ